MNDTDSRPATGAPEQPTRSTRRPGRLREALARRLGHYGMLGVLLLLCAFFSLVTLRPQHPTGDRAAASVAERALASAPDAVLLIAARATEEDRRFAKALETELVSSELRPASAVSNDPADLRRALLLNVLKRRSLVRLRFLHLFERGGGPLGLGFRDLFERRRRLLRGCLLRQNDNSAV